MLYPEIINVKKSRQIINVLKVISIFISIILIIINYATSSKLSWSIVSITGLIYLWLSIFYALDKSVNLASYTFFQMIGGSVLLFVIDYVFGFKKWSLSIGIPIVIMVSNISMVIITMLKYRKYTRYALYEILILLFSIIYNIIISMASSHSPLLNIITFWISITNLSFILILNFDVIKVEFQKKFHL